MKNKIIGILFLLPIISLMLVGIWQHPLLLPTACLSGVVVWLTISGIARLLE